MTEKIVPRKCKRCALLGNCAFLRPETCQHFRAIPSNSLPSVLVRVSDERAQPTPSTSAKFIVFADIGSGIGYGLIVSFALMAVFWACGEVLAWPIFEGKSIYSALFCTGAFTAGIVANHRATMPQRWRHTVLLSVLNLLWLVQGFSTWNVLFVVWGILCIVGGAALSFHVDHLPFLRYLVKKC